MKEDGFMPPVLKTESVCLISYRCLVASHHRVANQAVIEITMTLLVALKDREKKRERKMSNLKGVEVCPLSPFSIPRVFAPGGLLVQDRN